VINFGDIYQRQSSYVLGFHGTDKWVVDNVVDRQIEHLRISVDTTEWLGHGIYFWENDPERALDWAQNGKTKGKINQPDAVGAVIDPGFCLDLTTLAGLTEIAKVYQYLKDYFLQAGIDLPKNTVGKDKIKRELDCAVIQAVHNYRKTQGLDKYDSARALFPEGEPLYKDSGFRKHNHVQICIVKPERCIKGYFRPLQSLSSSDRA